MTKFAVIKTGGKQYKVIEGDVLKIEKVKSKNEKVELEEVLLIANSENIKIGKPLLPGVKVEAKVLEEGKGDKKIVFKYKSKTRQHKKKGHRQPYTKILITKISV